MSVFVVSSFLTIIYLYTILVAFYGRSCKKYSNISVAPDNCFRYQASTEGHTSLPGETPVALMLRLFSFSEIHCLIG